MNENVFRRVEQKYLITKKQKEALLKEINKDVVKDEYFESKILNIYFDNDHNDVLNTSLDKPIFKEKFRLRSYNIPTSDTKVFLEIKDKYRGIVGKRRIKMTLSDFYDYMEKGIMKDKQVAKDTQIMKEIDYGFKLFDLKPYVFVAYDRKSYKGKENELLRITIDENLRYRYDDLRLENGDKGIQYFDDDTYIMEIKTLDAMPLWLTRVLSSLKIYPTSFSKVGSIYEKTKGGKLNVE